MPGKANIDMTPDERRAFLKTVDVAVVCAPDAAGGLVARVVSFRAEDEDLVLDLAGPAADLPPGPGVVALIDAYPTYDQIKGVMLRGALTSTPGSAARLESRHASGFDFAKIPKA